VLGGAVDGDADQLAGRIEHRLQHLAVGRWIVGQTVRDGFDVLVERWVERRAAEQDLADIVE